MGLAWACLCGVLVMVEPSAAPSRDPSLDTLPKVQQNEALAREAWAAGVKAFGEGRLEDAIHFFEETYRYSGRPGPLFSLGQAHRHRWDQDQDHRQRQLAIMRYQKYLEIDPDGPRHLEAQRWIKELSLESELEGMGGPPPIFTRLGLSSRTPGATASIDGGAAVALPETPDVKPGKHTIVVSAPGFHAQTRVVEVPEGSTLPVELTLEPIDALLTVHGPNGADLWVDGQRVARLPAKGAIAVAPGKHQIGVAQSGHSLYVRDLELDHGQRERIDVALERTSQRKVAFAALAVGATATAASAVLMGLAFEMQRRGRSIVDHRDALSVKDERWREEERYEARRDTLRTAAIATGVGGLAVLATGIILHLIDRPPVASQLHRPRATALRSRGGVLRGRIDVGRGFAGASMRGAF